MADKLIYFSFGSNIHPARLQGRIGSAEFLSVGVLKNASIRFNKIGRDGSAKCNLEFLDETPDEVFGVLYDISREEKKHLDKCEPGYTEIDIHVVTAEGTAAAFTYVAMPDFINDSLRPFSWYKELVLLGASYYDFPSDYIDILDKQPAIPDNDKSRVEENKKLISSMRELAKRYI